MSQRDIFVHPSNTASANSSSEKRSPLKLAPENPLNVRASHLPVERYDHRKGLKSLQVHQSLMSVDGRIWSATPAGLACYDGVNIYMFDRKHGLSSHGLRTLALHPDNTLWLGTDIGIEVLDISGLVPVVLWSKQIGTVNCLDVGREKGVIGTSRGLFFWRGGKIVNGSDDLMLARATIKSVLVNEDGNTWVIGPRIGLAVFNEVETIIPNAGIVETIGTPIVLGSGPNGQIILGGVHGIACIENDGACVASFQTEARVSALLNYDGFIWAGVGTQLCRLHFQNGQLGLFDIVQDNIAVLHIANDSFDNIWISTGDQALIRISSMRKTFTESFDADIGSIMCIYRQQERLFIGGSNGLIKGNGQTVLKGMAIWDVLVDEFDKIWTATDSGLYCTVNPHFTIPYRHSDCDVAAAPCRAMVFYRGQLYVCSIRGLAVIGANGVREVLDPDGDSLGYVYSLHVGPQGRLWIATLGRGVFRMDDEGLQLVEISTLPKHSNVYAFAHDGQGDIYIAHDNLISKIDSDDTSSVLVDADVAIAAWTLKYLEGDRLVAGTSNGLIIYDTGDGAIRHKISGNFDDVPWEFTTSRSLETYDGRTVYCGLGSGLRKVNLDDLVQVDHRPRAELSYARWRGTQPIEDDSGSVCVEVGRWHLDIGLKTCWYLDDCTMRIRLSGFDDEWSPLTPVGPVHYTSLPVGDYHLEVEIYSPLAGAGPCQSIYKFSVR